MAEAKIGQGVQSGDITIVRTDERHITISTQSIPVTVYEYVADLDQALEFMRTVTKSDPSYQDELPDPTASHAIAFQWIPNEAIIFDHHTSGRIEQEV